MPIAGEGMIGMAPGKGRPPGGGKGIPPGSGGPIWRCIGGRAPGGGTRLYCILFK